MLIIIAVIFYRIRIGKIEQSKKNDECKGRSADFCVTNRILIG